MMKKRKLMLISLLLLVVYLVMVLVAPFEHNASFGLSLGASIMAILLGSIGPVVIFEKSNRNEQIFDFSVLKVAIVYVTVQLICSTFFMAFVSIPIWVELVLYTCVLALYLTFLMLVLFSKENVSEVQISVKEGKSTFKQIRLRIKVLTNNVEEPGVKKKLLAAYDAVKYSDPMSGSYTVELEQEICEIMSQIDKAVNAENYLKASEHCDVLIKKIQERKEICLLYKHK